VAVLSGKSRQLLKGSSAHSQNSLATVNPHPASIIGRYVSGPERVVAEGTWEEGRDRLWSLDGSEVNRCVHYADEVGAGWM